MLKVMGSCAVVLLAAHISIAAAHGQLPPIKTAAASEILADIRSSTAAVTVVNFWATWCAPCRDEFPVLLRVGREFGPKDVRMMFVSTDYAENVPEARQFLARQGISATTYVRSGNDTDFINTFYKEWSGGLPATIIYGPNGTVVDFWEGSASYETLKTRVDRAMGVSQ
jgi:thiol-disulfide isomerase/thioredoxin